MGCAGRWVPCGERILSGAIKRGDGEQIHAVIWYCDLRGFTELSESAPLDEVIALLNDYFDRMAAPVVAGGGEILKFIGDAMLAIFPCAATAGALCDACDAAIIAAEDAITGLAALNAARAAQGKARSTAASPCTWARSCTATSAPPAGSTSR